MPLPYFFHFLMMSESLIIICILLKNTGGADKVPSHFKVSASSVTVHSLKLSRKADVLLTRMWPQHSLDPVGTLSLTAYRYRFTLDPVGTLSLAGYRYRFTLDPVGTLSLAGYRYRFTLDPVGTLSLTGIGIGLPWIPRVHFVSRVIGIGFPVSF